MDINRSMTLINKVEETIENPMWHSDKELAVAELRTQVVIAYALTMIAKSLEDQDRMVEEVGRMAHEH